MVKENREIVFCHIAHPYAILSKVLGHLLFTAVECHYRHYIGLRLVKTQEQGLSMGFMAEISCIQAILR